MQDDKSGFTGTKVKLLWLMMARCHLGVSASWPAFECLQSRDPDKHKKKLFLLYPWLTNKLLWCFWFGNHSRLIFKCVHPVQEVIGDNSCKVFPNPVMAHEGQSIKLMPNQIWNEIIALEITSLKHPATCWQTGNQNVCWHVSFWKRQITDVVLWIPLLTVHRMQQSSLWKWSDYTAVQYVNDQVVRQSITGKFEHGCCPRLR